jgi:VIT1/CCC1 family predicted Fe2+/Mn2+ transporter
MYLVRTVTERGRLLTLLRSVQAAADAETGRRLIGRFLPGAAAGLVLPVEVEAIRGRILELPSIPRRPTLERDDLLSALTIFVIVVLSTFPVVLPFVFIADVGTAKLASRVVALAMLFFGGLALGHVAGYGSWKTGVMMAGLGVALVGAIMARGG